MILRRFLGGNLKWAWLCAALFAGALLGVSSPAGADPTAQLQFITSAQTMNAGDLSGTITVQRQDLSGNPLTGESAPTAITVQLSTSSAGGVFRDTGDTIDISSVTILGGESDASFKYKDSTPGTPTITAADDPDGFKPAQQTETINVGPVDHFSVAALGSTNAGDAFSVTVTAQDEFNNVVAGYTGTVHFTSTDTKDSTVLPDDYTFNGDDQGSHTFTDVKLTTTGDQTITATDPGAGKSGTSGPITVNPGPIGKFVWVNPGPTEHAGSSIDAALTAYDVYGNVKTNESNESASITGLNNAPNGSSTASYGSWSDGVNNGPFIDYLTENTALTVADGDVHASTDTFEVHPGPIGSFDWSGGQPGPQQTAGQNIDATVKAYDAYGNFDSDYTGHASDFSGLSPSVGGCPAATDPCQPNYPAFNGGTATGFKDFKSEDNVGVTAADGAATGTSSSFDVGPAPASHFSIPTPGTQTAGHPFDVSMTALDPWENVDTNYGSATSGVVALSFSGPNNSPNGSAPTYPPTVAFAAGQATATVTLVDAEDTLLKELDPSTGVSGETPSNLTVLPGELNHFTVGGPTVVSDPPTPARAGHDSHATVTAYDAFGNVKTNYTPDTGQPVLSGDLNNSSTGCGGNPCAPIYSGAGYGVGPFGPHGTATATFRPFKAESGRHITVTDTGLNKAGSSGAFIVSPGDLDHFVVGAPSPAPRAGYDSTVAITAYDAYGNVKTDYTGTPTQSGNLNNSPVGCSGPCSPVYGPASAFAGGNSSATFRPFVATEPGPPATPTSETNRHVTVTDTGLSKSGTSPAFNILPGDPKTLAFVKQPTETCAAKPSTLVCASDTTKSAIINGATGVQVSVTDAFGNAAYNTNVHVLLGQNPGSTVLHGTLTQATNANGIATFNDLTITVVALGYTLSATSPASSPTAGPTPSFRFNIAQSVTTCTTSCSGTATDAQSSILSVSGAGQFLAGNTLGVALTQAAPPIPTGACTSFGTAPSYSASYANVNQVQNQGVQPSLTITWTIPKSVVKKIPNIPQNNNNGASHYDICLGTIDLTNPFNNPPEQGWPTKSGGFALPAPDPTSPDPAKPYIHFWGIIPDCPKRGPRANPCMVSRGKDASGNLILTYLVPFPFDPTGWAGGGI